jgi:hypothetical protein
VHEKCAVGASQAPCRRHVGHSRVERPRSLGCGGGRCRPVHSARPSDCSGEHRQSRALARALVTRAPVRSPSSDWPLSLRVRGAELLLARPRPSVLAELAVEVAVWRRVQQTNTGRIPLDAFRVTLSGLAPVSWLPRVHAGPPILRIRGQVAPGQLRQKVSASSPYACDLPLLVQAREARRGWGVSSAVSPGNVLRARRRDTRDHRVVPSRLAQGRPTSGVVGDRSYSLAREPASSFIKYGTDAQP